jgi:Tfp pilus assembly protein FimV
MLNSSDFPRTQKKGATAKKEIAKIQSQASSAKSPEQKRREAEKAQREAEKKAAEQAKKETAELFKPVQVQKVPFGVDPKTIVCQFYKNGNCEKGSH